MEYKVYTYTFKRKLSQEQEDLLIAGFQELTNLVKKRLEKTRNLLKSPIYLSMTGQYGKTYKNILDYILNNFYTLFTLEKDDKKLAYHFKIANKSLTTLDTSLPVLKNQTFTDKINRMLKGEFKTQISQKLAIPNDSISLTISEEKH